MKFFSTFQFKKFLLELYNKAFDTDVFNHSAQVAFYFSFSFFPLLLFLVSLFGLILESTDKLRNQLLIYLAQIMPGSAYDLVHKTLDEIVETSSGGKLTLGLLVLLWSASAGVDSLRSSLNAVYELKDSRSWWHTKLQSLVMTFLFIMVVAVVLAGVTSGWQTVKFLLGSIGLEVSSPWLLVSIQWAAIVAVMLFATGVIYSWLPCFRRFKWVWISPGAIVAILLWVAFTGIFRLYLQYFNTYNKAYGSLGAVIILMLWMYLTAMAILIGGAINSVLTEMTDASSEDNKEMPVSEEDVDIESPS
ncbi:MAG: YihY/virulence factor BrkB family protein [Saprospiraceae bacterium]|nr:YihY/virulence factor BrkB family protein [Pyrinomonadaceae bacterium]